MIRICFRTYKKKIDKIYDYICIITDKKNKHDYINIIERRLNDSIKKCYNAY